MSVPLEQLRELIIGLLPRLRRLAHAITESTHSADDLVQLCIEQALRECSQWRSDQDFESELFSMVAQSCAPASSTHRQHLPAAEEAALRRAYASLPLQQRVAIALVVLEQRSYRETAAVLDLPLAALTQQLWAGRELLQAQLPA